ncbi:hypothetical protein B6A10_01545 [Flavobacterium sp. L1I52]|uniref:PEP-CTERM protein-sorting domain-containing protein n=1 Tax=Flavobacterium pokkalii TaxID=1940408 RepID=A0ABR7ULV1_9FLAO|nr:hypothetical protein [Flavobacterium pokkalii]MBD0723857.1 hypothetical protein [Flavobacterium pokkalii]
MGKIFNKYSGGLFFFFAGKLIAFADAEPPEPTSAPVSLSGPVTPPGLPIEENLVVLLIVALLFGFYKIYCSIDKKKRPV